MSAKVNKFKRLELELLGVKSPAGKIIGFNMKGIGNGYINSVYLKIQEVQNVR